MKKATLVLLLWLVLTLRADAFIYLYEPASYELGRDNVSIVAREVSNWNPFAAYTYLTLWATVDPYFGGDIKGYRIATVDIGVLLPYTSSYFINTTVPLHIPPNGKYYISLIATRWDGTTGYLNDSLLLGIETFGPKQPGITSASSTNGLLETAFRYQITASNGPTGFGALYLPPGLVVSPRTGLITGVPLVAGSYTSAIYATNTGGIGYQDLQIDINKLTPSIKSALAITAPAGANFIYQITSTQAPDLYSADNLPSGLQLNEITGTIYGQVDAPGTYNITVHTSNSVGSDAESLQFNFTGAAPAITNQPQSLVVVPGNAAEFDVYSGGTPPLTYQWRLNGTNIPDAKNPSLLLPSAAEANGGKYSVVVSNAWGHAVSKDATLIVSTFARSAVSTAACRSFVLEAIDMSDAEGSILSFFTTSDGRKDVRPYFQDLGSNYLDSGEFRPRAGTAGLYETDLGSRNGQQLWTEYGNITATIPTDDLDGNRLPDILQLASSGYFSTTSTFTFDYPYTNTFVVTSDFQREPGQATGTLSHYNNSGNPIQGTWRLTHAEGSLTYLRTNGQNLATVQLVISDPLGNVFSVQGFTTFVVNSVDQLTLPPFTLTGTGDNKRRYSIPGNTILKRSGNQYRGALKFADGFPETRWADYVDWVLEFTDLNDYNANGIPDLSDRAPAVPAFTRPPLAQKATAGSNTTFTAVAIGTGPLSYCWKFNGTPIADATNLIFSIPLVTTPNQGNYSLMISNVAGIIESKPAFLTVVCPYTLTSSQSNFPSSGGAGTFQITAGASCGWTLENTNAWIVLGEKSDNDIGVVRSFTVLPNLSPLPRDCFVKVANKSLHITQQGQVYFQFSAASYTATESARQALITITRRGPVAGSFSVAFNTMDGSAVAGVDYLPTNGVAVFPPGVMLRNFLVPILSDTIDETNKALTLALSEPTGGAALGDPNTASLTIADDDSGGAIRFGAAAFSVTEAGAMATITVVRSGGLASGVSVDLLLADGTATAGLDYLDVSTNLFFAANEVAKVIRIPVLNDSLDETNETVLLSLRNPTGGATLGVISNAVLTILDNDTGGTITFSAAQYKASETNAEAIITLTRVGGTAGGVTVDYFTTLGTALEGLDFTSTFGTVFFASNELKKTFSLPLIDDLLTDGSKTILLSLSNATGGALLGLQKTATLTVTDNDTASIALAQSQLRDITGKLSVARDAHGEVVLSFVLSDAAIVHIESSSDLTTWTRIGSLDQPLAKGIFRDTRPAAVDKCFYRLILE